MSKNLLAERLAYLSELDVNNSNFDLLTTRLSYLDKKDNKEKKLKVARKSIRQMRLTRRLTN